MGKVNQNITIWKGNYVELSAVIDDVSDLAGSVITWAMSIDASTAKLITKSTETTVPGVTIEDNIVTVILNPSDTNDASGIAAGDYYHEIRIVDPGGNPSTPLIGKVELRNVIIKT